MNLRWTVPIVALALAAGMWTLTLGAPAQASERTAGDATANDGIETATFSMYCYWTGEASLGRLDGIVASRIGHWQGREVVQVDYDASMTDLKEMVGALKRQRSFYSVVTSDVESRNAAAQVVDADEVVLLKGKPHFIEPKHSLRVAKPQIYALDITEAQAIALNAWAHFGGQMPDVLTDEQREQLRQDSRSRR